jgi:hypothetical protein
MEIQKVIKRRYNYEALIIAIKRDKATFNEDNYKNAALNRSSRIEFMCECKTIYTKALQQLCDVSGAFCEKCTKKNFREKCIKTSLERYGTKNPLQNKDILQKVKNTNKERYGNDWGFQSEIVKDKIKKTNNINYGTDYGFQSEIVKDKIKKTNMIRYDAENPLQNKDIRNKMEETNIKRYGAKNVFQNEEIKEKSKQTLIKLYGVDHNSKTPEFKEKFMNTMLKNYGVRHNMHVPEIAEKCSKNAYKRKEIVKSNGESIYLQGFEPQAYEILLKTYKEEEIITDNKLKPEIWWYDSIIKDHRYYPDFYIPKHNLIIEVKSERTFSLDDKKEKISETKLMCNFLSYNFELWILNEKGDILEKHI